MKNKSSCLPVKDCLYNTSQKMFELEISIPFIGPLFLLGLLRMLISSRGVRMMGRGAKILLRVVPFRRFPQKINIYIKIFLKRASSVRLIFFFFSLVGMTWNR